jgi:phospho-N-acetylmuramoyl-pentapeptide-transferase
MISIWLSEVTGYIVFENRLFRAAAASLVSFGLVFFAMPGIIRFLKRHNATSDFDDKNPHSVPIMGGSLLVLVVLFTSVLFAALNAFVVSILVIMMTYAAVGAIDDVLKVINKRKIIRGELSKKDYMDKADGLSTQTRLICYFLFSLAVAVFAYKFIPGLTGHLTVPFVKPDIWHPYLPAWALILLTSLVTTATANGANFTDGLDTLVSIPLITTASFVGIVAYISGNAIAAKYFLIPHVIGVDELLPVTSAIVGSILAYLWFNSPPAQIYMGDTGSIGLGAAIGMMFVLINAQLFLPLVGIIFVAEATSVVLQIGGFKLTRRFSQNKQGRRLFLRAPLHEHYKLKWQSLYPTPFMRNSKILWRFHLVSIVALIAGLMVFFKMR